MLDFMIFICFLLNIINLCLLISILSTEDNNTDLLLDIEKNQRRLFKKGNRK